MNRPYYCGKRLFLFLFSCKSNNLSEKTLDNSLQSNQLNFDELTLYQNDKSIYDSFTVRYFEETNNISKTSASNVYKVSNGNKEKLTNKDQSASGLALVVSGNKVLKSQNRTSIQSSDGSIYVFTF